MIDSWRRLRQFHFMDSVSITVFKSKCQELLSKLGRTQRPLLITKDNKPVATVMPISEEGAAGLDYFRGTVAKYGDIVSPTGESWDADQ